MASKSEAVPVSLLRKRDDAPKFPGLDRIGERLARALHNVIASVGADRASVSVGATKLKSFGEWRGEQDAFGALCRYQLPPIKGAMLMAIPPALIIQMVDLFYGGTGEVSSARAEFTAAESRYVTRFGEQCLGGALQHPSHAPGGFDRRKIAQRSCRYGRRACGRHDTAFFPTFVTRAAGCRVLCEGR